ncbi:MAG: DUF4166 domain-containing protein [Pseudomonadota bacterium]
MTLYQKILGARFDALPAPVLKFHAMEKKHRYAGTARIERGRHSLARLTCAVIGFPKAGDNVPVTVTIAPSQLGELWTRNFDGKRFSSFQAEGRGRDEGLIIESFGAIRVALELRLEDGRLYLHPRRWSLLGLPLPSAMLPGGTTFETEQNGRFQFHVEITAPIMGLIVSYKGLLDPVREG